MAPKDYVSRKPTPKKKQPAPKRNLPLVAIILSVVFIAAFVGALLFLNKQPSDPHPIVQKPESKPDALPDVPEEQWEYVESLPKQTITVEVPEQAESNQQYRLQCGSFKTHSQAEQMKARMAFQGLSAFIQETSGSNGKWFRVVLGPFDSKRDAERDRHVARRAGVTTCQMLELKV